MFVDWLESILKKIKKFFKYCAFPSASALLETRRQGGPPHLPVSTWNGQWPCSDLCGSCTNHHHRGADHLTVSVLWGSIASKLTAPALTSNSRSEPLNPRLPASLRTSRFPERDSRDSPLSAQAVRLQRSELIELHSLIDFSDHWARCLRGRTQDRGIWSNVPKRGCHESAWNPRIHVRHNELAVSVNLFFF